MTPRTQVYEAIDSEREYQDAKWGGTLSGDRQPTAEQPAGYRTCDEFCMYIVGYSHQLLDNASRFSSTDDKLQIVRKIAGLCVACMEQHGAPKREVV